VAEHQKGIEVPLTRSPLSPDILRRIEESGGDLKNFEAARQKAVDEFEARRRTLTTLMLSLFPSIAELTEIETNSFAGSYVHPKQGTRPTKVGSDRFLKELGFPVDASAISHDMGLLEVGFYTTKGGWNLAGGCQQCFPFKRNVVPIIGGVFIGGKRLTDGEIAKLGLDVVRDDQGKPVKYKIFATGGRSGLIPGEFSMAVVRTEKGYRMLESDREMREIAQATIEPGDLHELRGFAESLVAKSVEDARRFAAGQLPEPLDSGESLVEEFYDNLLVGALVKKGAVEMKQVVGIQLKGLGGRYKLHLTRKVGEGEVELNLQDPDADKVGIKYVKIPGLEGTVGIIVDLNYNPDVPRPIGGAPTKERLERERDVILAKNGAVLSGMTVGDVRLLDRGQVPQLCIQAIGETCRVVFDDTRRAGIFQMDPGRGTMNYMQYLRERYDNYIPEANLEEERKEHFSLFSRNVGTNMKAILDSGFTVPHDQLLVWNVSTVGGLTDSTMLSPLSEPKVAMSLCVGFLRMIDGVYGVTGSGRENPDSFFATEHFRELVSAFIDKESADRMMSLASREMPSGDFRDIEHRNKVLIKISGVLTDMWMKSKGFGYRSVWGMQDYQVIRKLEGDPLLCEKIGFKREMLANMKKVLKRPDGRVLMSDGKMLTGADAVEELRYKIDSQERYLAGLSTGENNMGQYDND